MIGANISYRNYVEGIKNLKEAGYKYVYFDSDFLIDTKIDKLKYVNKLVKNFELVSFSLHNIWMFPEDFKKINDFVSLQKIFLKNVKF